MGKVVKYGGGRALQPTSMLARSASRGIQRQEMVGYVVSTLQAAIIYKAIETGEAVVALVNAFDELVADMNTDEVTARRYLVRIFDTTHDAVALTFEEFTDAALAILDEVKRKAVRS